MVKVMIMVRKRPDLDADDLRRHVNNVHLPLVARLPGLEHLVANHVLGTADGGMPPYDAVMEAMQAGFAGPEGQAVAADLPTFADPQQLRIVVVAEAEMPVAMTMRGDGR